MKKIERMKDINGLYDKQTKTIVGQLKDNANRQTSAIFAGALVILAGILAVNTSWVGSGISAVVALVFWVKAR